MAPCVKRQHRCGRVRAILLLVRRDSHGSLSTLREEMWPSRPVGLTVNPYRALPFRRYVEPGGSLDLLPLHSVKTDRQRVQTVTQPIQQDPANWVHFVADFAAWRGRIVEFS
jgi:hypothetical protein